MAESKNSFQNEKQAEEAVQSILKQESFESVEQAQHFIEAIYYGRSQGIFNLKTLSQTLESNIKTVFNSAHKYIYELLQNADDVSAGEVEIEVKNGRLMFAHSGKHFRPCDVEKICDNAQSSGNKSDDINKTGYKGVGFKANFCISNKITIISDSVCFRFDEDYFKNREIRYPWPILPIWTDKQHLINNQLNNFSPKKVYFLLENINEAAVKNEINEIFESPEVLLLLRNISKVKLLHLGLEIHRERDEKTITLTKIQNNNLVYKKVYLVYNEMISIPDEEKQNLQCLSPSECPEKLKTAEKVVITFAVELNENNRPIPATEARFFSYLPTDIKSHLPFWVNAEFLLKQDRGYLLDNFWNQFLLKKIGELQFKILRSIAQESSLKNTVVSLLPNAQMLNPQLAHFKNSYEKGYKIGAAETAFIPSVDDGLLKLNECFVDQCNFFCQKLGGFSKAQETMALFPEQFNTNKVFIANHLLESKDKLVQHHKVRSFKVNDLLEKLEAYVKTIYPINKEAFKILLTYLANINDYTSLERLRKDKWLPLSNGKFQAPAKCFLAAEHGKGLEKQFELDIIDQVIFPNDSVNKQKVTDWLLKCLDVACISNIDIIKIHFSKLIQEDKVDDELSVQMLEFIYNTYLIFRNFKRLEASGNS